MGGGPHSALYFFRCAVAAMPSATTTTVSPSAAKPAVNLHEHHRAAFVLLLNNFHGLTRQPLQSPLDLDRVMKVSQAMRNMLAWCAASTTAANAVQEYYTFDCQVQRDKLAPLLAVIGVCIEAMGMPGWGKAVEAVQTSQKHFEAILNWSKAVEEHVRRARLESSCTTAAQELVDALCDVQRRGRCEQHYSPLAEHDMYLVVKLRQAAGVVLRWLVAENPALVDGVRSTLRDLLEECTRRDNEARPTGEATLEQLAEVVAKQVMGGQMAELETRLKAVEVAAAETKSVAFAAEQIAAAADEAVASIKKSHGAKHGGGAKPSAAHALADAVKGLEGRMVALERKVPVAKREEVRHADVEVRVAALERRSPAAANREELRALARQVDAMDDLLGSVTTATQSTTGRLATRLAAAESAIERLAARLEESEAAADRLAARLEAAEAAKERLTTQVEWATSQMHTHFAWRWNEVQAYWHALQVYGGGGAPPSPELES